MKECSEKSLKLNAVLNGIRHAASILFPLISFPYVTRILMESNYGKVSWCSSVISYFMLLAQLGTSQYALREGAGIRNDPEKINHFTSQIFSLSLFSSCFSFLAFIIMLLFGHFGEDIRMILLIQGVNILLAAFGFEWIFSIFEDFLFITIRSVGIHIAAVISIFCLVKKADDYIVYAAIFAVAEAIGYLCNFIHAKKYVCLKLTKNIEIKKHIRPILLLFANIAMITLYTNSDITMLGIVKDNATVGIYKVTVQIYTMVKSLLNAVSAVVLPRLAYYLLSGNNDEYQKLFRSTLQSLMTLVLPAVTGLFMISKSLLVLFGNGAYLQGTTSLRILSLALIAATLANVFVNIVLIVNRRENKALLSAVVSAVLNISLNFLFIPLWGMNGAAFTTLIAEFCVMGMSIYFCKDLVSLNNNGNVLFTVLAGCILIVTVCIAIDSLKLAFVPDLLLKIGLSVIIYLLSQVLMKNEVVTGLLKKS